MSRTLVFGATGQVGSALGQLLGRDCVSVDFPNVDLGKPESLAGVLDKYAPSVVINAAAYTAVDKAESEEDLARRINGDAPGAMARWCAARDVPFVHYSTDYVFAGNGERPWLEEDPVGPLNAYGRTKLEGERQVAAAGGKWFVFRTSWVYDATGKNFLRTMLRLGGEREQLKVVGDQYGAPTYAPHLARATLEALAQGARQAQFPNGIYHLCNTGETTWHGFTQAIFEAARAKGISLRVKQVDPIPTSDYPTPAKRPQNSRMSTDKAYRNLGVRLPDWRQGLKDCMELIR